MSVIQIVFAHGQCKSPLAPFGYEQGLPWGHVREDLKWFKEITENTVLVMGAKTFMSLPGKLPGRKHLVVCDTNRSVPLAKDGSEPDFVEETLEDALRRNWKYSIIGGPELIYEGLQYADVVYRSSIWLDCEADVYIDLQQIYTHFPYSEIINKLETSRGFGLCIDKHTKVIK